MTDDANWYPFSRDLDENRDFSPWTQRAFLHLSERLVTLFKDEIEEFHISLWEQQDTDDDQGPYHVEVCAFGADGFASKRRLADWLRAEFCHSRKSSWFGERMAKRKALIALRDDIDKIIAELGESLPTTNGDCE